MHIRTPEQFPYRVVREDLWIPTPTGEHLYARVWRPVTEEPVPVLLEYLPYRLSDWTAPRDAQRHPWYAGHGYASVRVDVRGHGNAEGLPGDEYDERELADGEAVIAWLAAQPWSSGGVGMFGISWGGFNSLQLAARAPEALKAIVTVCSSDDRYDNDVHYMGGSVLAVDMHAWASTMLAFASRPPDPAQVGDAWREMWLRRLEAIDPFIHTWLDHQTRDDYWRHGSACENYAAVDAAVLAVGGWHDPYRDTVLRLVEHLPGASGAPVRGLIGPWSHQYPDRGLPPGPAIGFLQETLRWWDRWLKNEDTGVMDEPLLRSWISESHPPATVYEQLEGRWVGDREWPSPAVTMTPYELPGSGPFVVRSPQHTGVDAGRFFPFGNEADLPPDQREEDGRSVCFDSAVLDGRVEVLGRPRVRLRLTSQVPRGQVVARVCDVAPDGSSTLVTRGVLNLSARHGRDRVVEWEPGATEDVGFELNGIGHAFPAGHRIRIALSSAYWPWIWPQPGSEAGWVLDPSHSALELPVRNPAADEGAPAIRFGEPEQAEPLGVRYPDAEGGTQRPERRVVRDVAAGRWRLEVDPRYGGTRIYPDGLEFTENALETYVIDEGDPLSARAVSEWEVGLRRRDLGWHARLRTRSELRADETDFIAVNEVTCWDGETEVFSRAWERRIRRTAG
ncbi:CocE/NonD family hydrolase [Streptomyces reniochalinae]|uniref:CocE/NonD family hydrolase n=1 Tax=Streptomyces reniochalinae TaxID=2250578 RepID=A0A367E8K6_9ACTN|nr:CocE/NonD family hydrolase [Streptomyces reniochalinae]RCG14109.1 CocE/NonD family hydrolase [Streptomyces reniochalinae]